MNVIERLRELEAKATPGPYRRSNFVDGSSLLGPGGEHRGMDKDMVFSLGAMNGDPVLDQQNADMDLLAALRNLSQPMLNVIEVLIEEYDPEVGIHSIARVEQALDAFMNAAEKEFE